MNKTKGYYGNNSFHSGKCNSTLESDYNTEFTNIKYFGPPYIWCEQCGHQNKTYFKPYSKISTFSKIKFWTKRIFFPTIIWFIAAPSLLIGFGSKLIMGYVLDFDKFIVVIVIFGVAGVSYIVKTKYQTI